MSEDEIQQQMDAMRALDEPMPQVGIFWYDPQDHTSLTYIIHKYSTIFF